MAATGGDEPRVSKRSRAVPGATTRVDAASASRIGSAAREAASCASSDAPTTTGTTTHGSAAARVASAQCASVSKIDIAPPRSAGAMPLKPAAMFEVDSHVAFMNCFGHDAARLRSAAPNLLPPTLTPERAALARRGRARKPLGPC